MQNLVRHDGVENEISQAGRDDNPNVWFVCFSSRKWMVGQLARSVDKASDEA
jgi:hypothetical protein